MTNEQLVIRIQAREDVSENMAALYEQTRAFIHSIAWKYRGYEELEDLEQEGYLGLCDAVDKYDPDAGVLFLTYAAHWIRRRMVRYIESSALYRRSAEGAQFMRQYKKLENFMLVRRGRRPSDLEIRGYLRINQRNLDRLREAAEMGKIRSLDAHLIDDEDMTLGDTIDAGVDVEGDVLEDVQAEELRAVIWPLVDRLGGQRSAVIRARYQGQETGREIGARMGIGAQRVSQIEKEALRELRKKGYLLRPFLPDALGSVAYSGGAGTFQRTWTSSTERAAMRL